VTKGKLDSAKLHEKLEQKTSCRTKDMDDVRLKELKAPVAESCLKSNVRTMSEQCQITDGKIRMRTIQKYQRNN